MKDPLVLGLVAATVAMVWLGWWLSRPAKPRRGGYVGDRWKD